MTGIEDVLMWSLAQKGDTYVFGAPFNRGDLNPTEFDCSGLVEWSCRHAGVSPAMPTGSWLQAAFCMQHGGQMDVAEAIATRGALLFKFLDDDDQPVDPVTATKRPPQAHVAFSLGDGTTMEAASQKVGVGVLMTEHRIWTHAARIPNVDYSPGVKSEEDDEMVQVAWFAGPDGAAHPYAVSGVNGKFLSEEALNTQVFLGAKVQGEREAPLGLAFSSGFVLVDGPCKNV